jgi:hypothetical protein
MGPRAPEPLVSRGGRNGGGGRCPFFCLPDGADSGQAAGEYPGERFRVPDADQIRIGRGSVDTHTTAERLAAIAGHGCASTPAPPWVQQQVIRPCVRSLGVASVKPRALDIGRSAGSPVWVWGVSVRASAFPGIAGTRCGADC